jgi:hypothetical protein
MIVQNKKAMFVDTVNAGDWNAWVAYGIMGGEAGYFGETFHDALNHYQGFEDVWMSFLFFIKRIPANAGMSPKLNVFSLNSRIDTPVSGWGMNFSVYTADSGENLKGDLVLDVVRADLGNWVRDVINNLLLKNVDFSVPHRVAVRGYYTSDPSGSFLIKEIYIDDTLVASPNRQVSTYASGVFYYYCGSGYEDYPLTKRIGTRSGDTWVIDLPIGTYRFSVSQTGGPAYGTYSGTINGVPFSGVDYYHPVQFTVSGAPTTVTITASDPLDSYLRYWDIYTSCGSSYGDFEVDDVLAWTGPTYYEYNWLGTYRTLIITAASGGTTDPAPERYDYKDGTSVVVTALPDAGYRFSHWELDGTTRIENPVTIVMAMDYSLRAVFELATIILQVVSGENGSVSPSGSQTLTTGQSYQFAALPNVGYQLDHWDLAGANIGSTNPMSITAVASMDGLTLTVLFTNIPPAQITIQIAVTGNGTTTPAVGTHIFNVGDSIQFTATPNNNSSFTDWKFNGATYTENPLVFTITQEMDGKTLTAEFTAIVTAGFPYWILLIIGGVAVGAYVLSKKRS